MVGVGLSERSAHPAHDEAKEVPFRFPLPEYLMVIGRLMNMQIAAALNQYS